MRSRRGSLTLVLALVAFPLALVGLARPAFAQEEEPPPPDKDADWQEAFQRGIDLLRDRKVDKSIEAFETCRKLVPNKEEMILDYNVACAHAQKKDPAKACEFLKKAFAGGFLDLEHVARDTDLDPIRDDAGYKKLVDATKKLVLDAHPKARRIVPASAPATKRALVVYVNKGGVPLESIEEQLKPVAESVGCVVLIPGARSTDGEAAQWDSSAETCIVSDVEEALADTSLAIDADRVIMAGELGGARLALDVAFAHGWKRVIASTGVYAVPGANDLKDARVYLFAPVLLERAQSEARHIRDAVLAAGGHVVIERPTGTQTFPKDFAPAFERAVRWTLGEKVTLPGTDETSKF